MAAKGVLDMSFNELADKKDIDACIGVMEKAEEHERGGAPLSPMKKKRRMDETKAVRLGNNNISDVNVLVDGLSSVVDPLNIHWLDLSFNNIECLTEAFATSFPNLSLLYLQANQITKLTQLKRLSYFKNLKSLTVFGNPVEQSKHYRNMILWACPQLQILDFCPITAQQRGRNEIWAQVFRRKLYPDDYD